MLIMVEGLLQVLNSLPFFWEESVFYFNGKNTVSFILNLFKICEKVLFIERNSYILKISLKYNPKSPILKLIFNLIVYLKKNYWL